jgi:hypothetical protein
MPNDLLSRHPPELGHRDGLHSSTSWNKPTIMGAAVPGTTPRAQIPATETLRRARGTRQTGSRPRFDPNPQQVRPTASHTTLRDATEPVPAALRRMLPMLAILGARGSGGHDRTASDRSTAVVHGSPGTRPFLGQRGRSLAQIRANALEFVVTRGPRSGRRVAVSSCKLTGFEDLQRELARLTREQT